MGLGGYSFGMTHTYAYVDNGQATAEVAEDCRYDDTLHYDGCPHFPLRALGERVTVSQDGQALAARIERISRSGAGVVQYFCRWSGGAAWFYLAQVS